MNFYNYQRSRSFTDFCMDASESVFLTSSKSAGHLEPLWDGGMEDCAWDLDHMNKVATMPMGI